MRKASIWSWQRCTFGAAAVVALAAWIGAAPGSARAACVGDCNADGEVTIDELIKMVNIASGTGDLSTCSVGDANGDGEVTIDEIIKAVNAALNGCPMNGVCGDGNIDAAQGETCDDGGTCIGGSNAGTHCTAESQCQGNGVCVGGAKVGTSCADTNACGALGTCVHCRPLGGDGCAANCTAEVTVPYNLIPGEPDPADPLSIKAGTSGAVVHADILTIPLAIVGTQSIIIGKPSADGSVPFVIPAASVKFPKIPVAALACACVRGVSYKTCGGTIFDANGSLSPSCTDGFNGKEDCTGKPPCTFVHGSGNSATGILGCSDAGLAGTTVSLEQDSGGSSGEAGKVSISLTGSGPKGSAILVNSTAIGTVVGSCDDAGAGFCTDSDDISVRGTPQTLPFTTGSATAVVHNANGNDGVDVGPFSATGSAADCSKLSGSPPSTSGFATVGAFPALSQPMLGDIVVTNQFFAQ
ncbi:MAG: hypothetical protein HY270_09285 [Deltaproteobacteria bacterium]|nr:hypothetical protein [Deltaproteobacteria bacterium]